MDINKFKGFETPFYYYDRALLNQTLDTLLAQVAGESKWHVHYAIKANSNAAVLRVISGRRLEADCVSGGEIQAAVDAGFDPRKICFAGVGKTDREIRLGLQLGIGCFNVESIPELEVINQLAVESGLEAPVALRINPNVGAHTHVNIATGLTENKFGIDMVDMVSTMQLARQMNGIKLIGLHFHIGSQILDMQDFVALCERINELQDSLESQGVPLVENINVGGGLGIDYISPNEHPVPDFKSYFDVWREHLRLREYQHLHFELGRSVVAQMGSLITRVIYVKSNSIKRFAIVDAGMSDLIRPALYGAHHAVENISAPNAEHEVYDIVGPICESSDVFLENHSMPKCQRGDLLAIRSAGAYGEVMASHYNNRPLAQGYLI